MDRHYDSQAEFNFKVADNRGSIEVPVPVFTLLDELRKDMKQVKDVFEEAKIRLRTQNEDH